METIRSIIHAIGLFLSTVLDPVIVVLNGAGDAMRRAMDGMSVPAIVQPVGIITAWFIVILLLLRIYRVLPDI